MFGGKPARGLPTPPPTPPRREIAHLTRGKCASAISTHGIGARRMGRGGKNAKRCHSLTGQRINCKLKTKIANTILLLCYFDKMCLSPSGGLWQASAFLYSGQSLKKGFLWISWFLVDFLDSCGFPGKQFIATVCLGFRRVKNSLFLSVNTNRGLLHLHFILRKEK